jgi:hypothetical protein
LIILKFRFSEQILLGSSSLLLLIIIYSYIGWSCPDDPLHSGSICVTTPAYVPVVVTPEGQSPNSPSGGNTPSGNAPSDGNSPSGSNNPSTGSPFGSTPDQQQTSGSSKVEVLAITVAYLVALLY